MTEKIEVNKNPAVKVAKATAAGTGEQVEILSTGVRAKMVPVSPTLLQEIVTSVEDPDVPMWHNEQKKRDEPNPNDPAYVKALGKAQAERVQAATDAMVMFGIELLDSLPEDMTWVKKLKFMRIQIDEDDPIELEFAYKKYIACGNEDLLKLGELAGITQKAVDEAVASFRGDEKRESD